MESLLEDKTKNILLKFLPFICICGIPMFCFPQMFLYIVEEYYFAITALLFIGISAFVLIKNRKTVYSFTIVDLIIFLFFIYKLINSFLFIETFHVIPFVTVLLMAGIYTIVRRIYASHQSLNGFTISLMLIGFIEIISALLQKLNIIQNIQTNMPFGGSFANPAPLSIFIACIVPLVLHSLLYTKSSKLLKFVKVAFIVLAITLLVISKIRSSWIAITIGVSIVLAYRYSMVVRFRALGLKRKVVICTVFCILLISSAIVLFQFKKDSALGRVFIWENTIELIKQHPIIGVGNGNFIYGYNEVQSHRFESGNYTEKEFLLVGDDIKMAYNDVLQITAELGLIGCILFLCLIISLYKTLKDNTSYYNRENQIALLSIITIILLAGLSSYPLITLKINILFVIIIALLSSFSLQVSFIKCEFKIQNSILYKSVVLGILFISLGLITFQHIYLHRWKNAIETYTMGNKTESIKELNTIYPALSYNKQFVINYISAIIGYGDSERALSEFQSYDAYSNEYIYIMLRGDFYLNNKNLIEAESNYKQALHLIPSKFTPRYNLLICYIQLGRTKDAIAMANEILTTPIKKYSKNIEQIQNTAKHYLGTN